MAGVPGLQRDPLNQGPSCADLVTHRQWGNAFATDEHLLLAWQGNMHAKRATSERSRGNLARETVSRLTPHIV